MPVVQAATRLPVIERGGWTNQAEIFSSFQYLTRKKLPIGRQKMPPADARRQ